MKFIITGTGRSGTKYTSHLMRKCGILCGHEQVYGPLGHGWNRWTQENPEWEADSSWLAVPSLETFKRDHPSGHIFHVVRNPEDVIRSMLHTGFKLWASGEKNMFSEFKAQHVPKLFEKYKHPLDCAAYFYVEWNRRIEKYAERRYQVENLCADDIVDLLSRTGRTVSRETAQQALDAVETNTNTRKHQVDYEAVTYSDIRSAELRGQIKEMAKRYGYPPNLRDDFVERQPPTHQMC